MENKQLKEIRNLISLHKKTKDIKYLEQVLDFYNFPKCRISNKHILYPSTYGRISREDEFYLINANHTTQKTIFNKVYNLSVCYEELLNKFPEIKDKNPSKLFNTLNKYSAFAFQVPDDIYQKYVLGTAVTLENMIKKYGKEEGTLKYEKYRKEMGDKNTFERKKQKFGWTEEEFKEFNKTRAVTLENQIKKWGVEEGTKKYNAYCEKQAKNGNKLEYFVEKYGEQAGFDYYQEVCRKKGLAFLKRKNFDSLVHFSINSQKYFNLIEKYLISKKINFNLMYATKNKELFKWFEGKLYFFDLFIKELNLIVEFNGDFWHANPLKYKKEEILGYNRKAEDIWLKDEIKNNAIKGLGYNLEIVWESDEIEPSKLLEKYLKDYENKKSSS